MKRRPLLASLVRICSRSHSSSYLRFTSSPAVELFSPSADATSALASFSAARSLASDSRLMTLEASSILTLRAATTSQGLTACSG